MTDHTHGEKVFELAADAVASDDRRSPRVAAERLRARAAGTDADELAAIAELIDQLADLVHHMDIHASYRYGGYAKMTAEQRALYRTVTLWGEDDPPAFNTPTGRLD